MSRIAMMKVCSYSKHAQVIEKKDYLSRNATFYLLASITVSFLASSSAPTPLHAIYQEQRGFSPITVTVIFGMPFLYWQRCSVCKR
jgi:hypothetical protein